MIGIGGCAIATATIAIVVTIAITNAIVVTTTAADASVGLSSVLVTLEAGPPILIVVRHPFASSDAIVIFAPPSILPLSTLFQFQRQSIAALSLLVNASLQYFHLLPALFQRDASGLSQCVEFRLELIDEVTVGGGDEGPQGLGRGERRGHRAAVAVLAVLGGVRLLLLRLLMMEDTSRRHCLVFMLFIHTMDPTLSLSLSICWSTRSHCALK
mmetsp:Transcript_54555/g.163000  ORF Transcript_54555/g.163000 Transcript_54555/m.163000 type:complete len:213 (-) Transcript_54555:121-759(-)